MRFINIEGVIEKIRVFSNSQTAVQTIDSNSVGSNTILGCKQEINNFSTIGSIEILWLLVHCNIGGTEIVDELARESYYLRTTNSIKAQLFLGELRIYTVHRKIWDKS